LGLHPLSDLQRYADSLVGAPATRGRRLKTLKSLLSFATRMGYLPFNAGAAIHGPALEQKLAERILSERHRITNATEPTKIPSTGFFNSRHIFDGKSGKMSDRRGISAQLARRSGRHDLLNVRAIAVR
jgi:hypothetical protein